MCSLPFSVWLKVGSGQVSWAEQRKLVDVMGGLHEATGLVKQAAGIDQSEKVTVVEVSRALHQPIGADRWV